MAGLAKLLHVAVGLAAGSSPQTHCNAVLDRSVAAFHLSPAPDVQRLQAIVDEITALPDGRDGCDDETIARAHAVADEGVGILRVQAMAFDELGRDDLSMLAMWHDEPFLPRFARDECHFALTFFALAVEIDPYDAQVIRDLESAETVCIPGAREDLFANGPIDSRRYRSALKGIGPSDPGLTFDWRDRFFFGLAHNPRLLFLSPLAFPPLPRRARSNSYPFHGKYHSIDMSLF